MIDVTKLLETDRDFRTFVMKAAINDEAPSFFGTDFYDILYWYEPNMLPIGTLAHRLHSKLNPSSPVQMSVIMLGYLYMNRHPNATKVPQYVMSSVIAKNYRPNKDRVLECYKKSETYSRLKDMGYEDKFNNFDLLNDLCGCRRRVFVKAIAGELQMSDSLEYVVIDQFLKECGEEDMRSSFAKVADTGIKVETEEKISFYTEEVNPYSHLFTYGKVTNVADSTDIMIELAAHCYGKLVDYVNENKLEFVDELKVVDVLNCIMTLSASSMCVRMFHQHIKNETKRKSISEMIARYYSSMSPTENYANHKFVDLQLDAYEDTKNSNNVKVKKVLALFDKHLDKLRVDTKQEELLEEVRDRNSVFFEELRFCPLGLHGTPTHDLYAERSLLPFFATDTHNRNKTISAVRERRTEKLFDIFTPTALAHDIYNERLAVFERFCLNSSHIEILLEFIQIHFFSSDKLKKEEGKNMAEQFAERYEGPLADLCKTTVESIPNLLNPNYVLAGLECASDLIDAVHHFYQHVSDLEKEKTPEEMLQEITEYGKSEDFDPLVFAEMTKQYSDRMVNGSTGSNERQKLLEEVVAKANKVKLIDRESMLSTSSPVSHISAEDRQDLDEAMMLIEEVERERDELKKEKQILQTQLAEVEKRSYALERPAVCGSALIRYAKKGHLESVSHAVAEGLSEGRLRVLPSAWESAEESRYNLPAKVRDGLCILADRYIEDLKAGGVSLARKPHGRSFRGGESETVMNCDKLRDQRTFDVDGEQRVFSTHLSFGTKAAKNNHIRIYFDVDMENEQVIIAYCGKHLETMNSN